MTGALLPDSGFFFALYDPRDEHHVAASAKRDWLEMLPIVLPWPVLYEVVNTRFSRRREIMARFDALVMNPNTALLDDSPYRHDSYRAVLDMERRGRPLSLVDAVLRAVIEDTNVAVAAILTFNRADFMDVSLRNSVEVL